MNDALLDSLKSRGFVERSPGVWEKPKRSGDVDSRKPAVIERDHGKPITTPNPNEEAYTGHFLVSLVDCRRRLIDEDNLIAKYHVDCCRFAGFLPSDAPGKTTIKVGQRKLQEGEEPHVEISIERL